jgi:hypothetical protein
MPCLRPTERTLICLVAWCSAMAVLTGLTLQPAAHGGANRRYERAVSWSN